MSNKVVPRDGLLSPEYDTTIALMNVYLTEWMQRNERLWKQVITCFYALLIVILLPNLAGALSITLPPIPYRVYRVCGIILALFFLYASIGYAKRQEASAKTYQALINRLPVEYQRVKLVDVPLGKLFMPKLSVLICIAMFTVLISLSVFLLIYEQ